MTQDFSPTPLVMFTVGEKVRLPTAVAYHAVTLVSKGNVENIRLKRRIRYL